MKFTAGVFAAITGAAFAASAPYSAPMAPTGTPCPTGASTSPDMGGSAPYAPTGPSAPVVDNKYPTTPTTPTKTPCPTSMPGYTSGMPGTPSTPGYGSSTPTNPTTPGTHTTPTTPTTSHEPEVVDSTPGTNVSTVDGANATADGNTTVSVAADEKSGVAGVNADEGGAALTAATVGSGLGLSVSGRQEVTYTDEAGVQYYQDSTGQWWYYPSPTPGATPAAEMVAPGTEISIGNLTATSTGNTSVTAGATTTGAAAAGNGMNGVLAAAAATPGAPSSVGAAF